MKADNPAMAVLAHNTVDARLAICEVVGADHMRDAGLADAIDGVLPKWVVEPGSATELAKVLSVANDAGLHVIPRGGGTKIDWGNPPRAAEVILSTRRLNHVIEHAAGDMTSTVQAGCTVAAFDAFLAQRAQRLALDPLWPEKATIGGILATNDNGALRASYGTLRDHLIGITVAMTDGSLARSGGKVVKNVAGYDLPKLFTGSFGTLGIITEATFRLYPNAKVSRNLQFSVSGYDVLARVISALNECALVTSAVQIETDDTGGSIVQILVEGLPQAMDGKLQRVTQAALGSGARPVQADADAWRSRRRLFEGNAGCVLKYSVLPTQLPELFDGVRAACATGNAGWEVVGQAVGVGLLKVQTANAGALPDILSGLRNRVNKLDGSLIALRCPTSVKTQFDVWPDAGNSLAIMRRVKDKFDPKGILSPGRFIGGI